MKNFFLIHGGPGVGEAWTTNESEKRFSRENKKELCTACAGVAPS